MQINLHFQMSQAWNIRWHLYYKNINFLVFFLPKTKDTFKISILLRFNKWTYSMHLVAWNFLIYFTLIHFHLLNAGYSVCKCSVHWWGEIKFVKYFHYITFLMKAYLCSTCEVTWLLLVYGLVWALSSSSPGLSLPMCK